MNIQINRLTADAINQGMMVAETVVGLSRSAAKGTAQTMLKAKTPVRSAAETSIKLNDIAHKGLTRLVKVQARAIERTVEAGAARFELAAKAPSIKALVQGQLRLLPHTRDRLLGDLRDTWKVVSETGSEFGALLNGKQAVSKPGTRRKAKAKTTRKPRAKKASASKKTTGRKKTAGRRKVARKTAVRTRKAA